MFNGLITGSPIAADPDPNTTPPNEQRVVRVGQNKSVKGGVRTLFLYLIDGTSLDVTVWIKVVNAGVVSWFRFGSPIAVAKLVVSTATGIPADAAARAGSFGVVTEVFLQVTNPVGNPTMLGFAFTDG